MAEQLSNKRLRQLLDRGDTLEDGDLVSLIEEAQEARAKTLDIDRAVAERERVIVAQAKRLASAWEYDTPQNNALMLLVAQVLEGDHLRAFEAGELTEYLEVDGG